MTHATRGRGQAPRSPFAFASRSTGQHTGSGSGELDGERVQGAGTIRNTGAMRAGSLRALPVQVNTREPVHTRGRGALPVQVNRSHGSGDNATTHATRNTRGDALPCDMSQRASARVQVNRERTRGRAPNVKRERGRAPAPVQVEFSGLPQAGQPVVAGLPLGTCPNCVSKSPRGHFENPGPALWRVENFFAFLLPASAGVHSIRLFHSVVKRPLSVKTCYAIRETVTGAHFPKTAHFLVWENGPDQESPPEPRHASPALGGSILASAIARRPASGLGVQGTIEFQCAVEGGLSIGGLSVVNRRPFGCQSIARNVPERGQGASPAAFNGKGTGGNRPECSRTGSAARGGQRRPASPHYIVGPSRSIRPGNLIRPAASEICGPLFQS